MIMPIAATSNSAVSFLYRTPTEPQWLSPLQELCPQTLRRNLAHHELQPLRDISSFTSVTAATARVRKTLRPFPIRPLRLLAKPVQQAHHTTRSLQYTSPWKNVVCYWRLMPTKTDLDFATWNLMFFFAAAVWISQLQLKTLLRRKIK